MKKYESEKEFLENYDPSQYDKLSLTTDLIIFSVSSKEQKNYRKLTEKNFSILLLKRDKYPFKGKWCLPGGFVDINESISDAVSRILSEKLGNSDIYLEQLYTFGAVDRDPRMRVVSTSYMALLDRDRMEYSLCQNACWFNVYMNYDMENGLITVTFDNGNEKFEVIIRKTLVDQTTHKHKFEVIKNEDLAFDHALIIINAISRLKHKTEDTDIVFNMMPEYFTLGELQQVYEAILGRKLLDAAFRRIIAGKVIKTKKMQTGGGHRPSTMFKYNYDKED